jgi:hypothetical protein
MKLRLITLLATLFFAFAGAAHAQNGAFAPYVDGSIAFSGTGGVTSTSNPSYTVGGGVESSTKHLLLDVNAQFNSGNVSNLGGILSNTGGYTGTATGSAYYKLHGFLLGGGAFWSNQVASGQTLGESLQNVSFNYKQVRAFVGAGYQFKRDRIIATYLLPGIDQISGAGLQNAFTGVNSRVGTINNEIFLGTSGLRKHIRLTQTVSVSSANTNLQQAFSAAGLRTSAVTAGAGIKFVF